jgi:hypothetical protein
VFARPRLPGDAEAITETRKEQRKKEKRKLGLPPLSAALPKRGSAADFSHTVQRRPAALHWKKLRDMV